MHTIVYFSPTGNAFHLASLLAKGLMLPKEELLPMERTDPIKLKANRHLILLHPVHSFNAPRPVKRFVRSLPPGRFEYVSLIAVGSASTWHNHAVSSALRKSLTRKACTVVLDEVLAMPLTFIMKLSSEVNRKMIREAELRMEKLSRRILELDPSQRRVAFKSRMLNFIGRVESPAARLFGKELHANQNCTSCGICWTHCPQKNIQEKSNGKPGFGFNCIMCLRCVYDCPEKAISPRVSRFIPVKGGYSISDYLKE